MAASRKFLMTSYTFHPDIGGVTSFNTDLCTALVQLGHEVVLATLAPGPDDRYPFDVVRRPSRRHLRRLGRRADVILFSNLSLQLALPLMGLKRPMALFHHSEAAWISPRRPAIQVIERGVLARMAVHFPTSAYTGRASGLPHTVIHPPFDDQLHRLVEPASASERADVLFVGRLVPEKGLAFLVEHQESIRQILGCERILVAGDGELRPWVEGLTQENAALHYLGRLSRPEVVRAMARAAYVIVPSVTNEPFGIVALEALAAGSILISSNLGGLPEAAGSLGHLYDPTVRSDVQRALVAAREQRETLMKSADAEAAYRAALQRHLTLFSPEAAARAVVRRMCGTGAGEPVQAG